MNKEMELAVVNSGETTEVVEHLNKSTGGSFGKTLLGILGISAMGFGIARLVRVIKRRKKVAGEKVKTKEDLIQELENEGYTIVGPLDDLDDKSEDVVTEQN